MDFGSLINANISKKWGLAMLAMYFVTKSESQETAYTIAAIAVAGIFSQMVVDAVKAWKSPDAPITP